MVAPRLETGLSDPVSYTCTCPARDSQSSGGDGASGLVLLFYRYFSNRPALPSPLFPLSESRISELADWHAETTRRLRISGKIRVAGEGFNVTVGGTRAAVEEYVSLCSAHWSFAGLGLESPLSSPPRPSAHSDSFDSFDSPPSFPSSARVKTETEAEIQERRKRFFKPSRGCACVFAPAKECSVRICEEITPLGITGYAPRNWGVVEELVPAEFHRRCLRAGEMAEAEAEDVGGKGGQRRNVTLMDLRNHYESRVGFFVLPGGEAALRPQIRRFSQWPRFMIANEHDDEDGYVGGDDDEHDGAGPGGEQILTYCTGGIRCEKATRWMAERESNGTGGTRTRRKKKICTLKGGIAAYLDWVDEEIAAGRMSARDSLFKGKNYVFDARGAVGLTSAVAGSEKELEPVSQCHVCGEPEDRLNKCRSPACHLVLVICAACEDRDPRCCESCREISTAGTKQMCECEQKREAGLWGAEKGKTRKGQGWRKARNRDRKANIHIKMIDE